MCHSARSDCASLCLLFRWFVYRSSAPSLTLCPKSLSLGSRQHRAVQPSNHSETNLKELIFCCMLTVRLILFFLYVDWHASVLFGADWAYSGHNGVSPMQRKVLTFIFLFLYHFVFHFFSITLFLSPHLFLSPPLSLSFISSHTHTHSHRMLTLNV